MSAPTADQLCELNRRRGRGRVLAFYGMRRVVSGQTTTRPLTYVLQRQQRALGDWETVATTRSADNAAGWLADARLPSTDAYARATGQTGERL